jgi:hypothetical protein
LRVVAVDGAAWALTRRRAGVGGSMPVVDVGGIVAAVSCPGVQKARERMGGGTHQWGCSPLCYCINNDERRLMSSFVVLAQAGDVAAPRRVTMSFLRCWACQGGREWWATVVVGGGDR